MPRPFLVGLGVAAADLLCTAGLKTIKLGKEAQRYTGFASGGRAATPAVVGVDGRVSLEFLRRPWGQSREVLSNLLWCAVPRWTFAVILYWHACSQMQRPGEPGVGSCPLCDRHDGF